MKLREAVTKRVCPPHAWQFVDDDFGVMSVEIERVCAACKRKETCRVTHDLYRTLPKSLRHLADADWSVGI